MVRLSARARKVAATAVMAAVRAAVIQLPSRIASGCPVARSVRMISEVTLGRPRPEFSATMLAHFVIARFSSSEAPTRDWKKCPGAIDIVIFGSWTVRSWSLARKIRMIASRRSCGGGAMASTSAAVR